MPRSSAAYFRPTPPATNCGLLLDKYLHDEVARVELVEQLRSTVLESHTYDKRVNDFLAVVDAEFRRPCVAIKVGAPTWDVAEAWGGHALRSPFRGPPCAETDLEQISMCWRIGTTRVTKMPT